MQKETGEVKILGGFFVYRANPSTSTKLAKLLEEGETTADDVFGQKGEITGMVVIKKKGIRKFMAFVPVDPTNLKMDKLMTYFADTEYNNQYDNNKTNVFDMGALPALINKFIVQPADSAL
jgi:hypothetical protein